jgi:hypothetical protein
MRLKSLLAPVAVVAATSAVAAPAGANVPHDPVATSASVPAVHRATDLRSPDSVDRALVARAAAHPRLAGPPTWPSHPQVLAPPQGTVRASTPGTGVDVPEVALIGSGVLALIGLSGAGVVLVRRRRIATRVATS